MFFIITKKIDVHQCQYLYSKKGKIDDVPYYPIFETCGDVVALWPNSFPSLPKELYDLRILRDTLSENIWWEEYRDGTDPDTGIRWRITITMEYNTFPQALSGRISPSNVEISIRTWSTNGGKGPWNPKLQQVVSHWYKDLYYAFGKTFGTGILCT